MSHFFHFKPNSFIWRQSHFFPHWNFPPKDTCSLKRPWWSSLNGIRASTGLLVNNLFFWWPSHFWAFEPPNKNLPKGYLRLWWIYTKTSLHGHFHFIKKISSFGGRVTSLTLKLPYKNPKKVMVILERPGKPSWTAFFIIHRKFPLLIKSPYKTFWSPLLLKKKLWKRGRRTWVPEIWAHSVKHKVILNLYMCSSNIAYMTIKS